MDLDLVSDDGMGRELREDVKGWFNFNYPSNQSSVYITSTVCFSDGLFLYIYIHINIYIFRFSLSQLACKFHRLLITCKIYMQKKRVYVFGYLPFLLGRLRSSMQFSWERQLRFTFCTFFRPCLLFILFCLVFMFQDERTCNVAG